MNKKGKYMQTKHVRYCMLVLLFEALGIGHCTFYFVMRTLCVYGSRTHSLLSILYPLKCYSLTTHILAFVFHHFSFSLKSCRTFYALCVKILCTLNSMAHNVKRILYSPLFTAERNLLNLL